jgi:hypothetical protein
VRAVAGDHILVEQGHGCDGQAGPYAQCNWPKIGVLEMKRLGWVLIVGFLSVLSLGMSPASAVSCYPTQAAKAAIEHYNLKPVMLYGSFARQFLPVGYAAGAVDFAALVTLDDKSYLFFGNAEHVCGPFKVNPKIINKFLRPA